MATLVSRDTSGTFAAGAEEVELPEARTRSFKKFALPDAPDGRKRFRVGGQVGPVHYRLNPFDERLQFEEIDLDLVPGKDCDWEALSNGWQARIWQVKDGAPYVIRFTRAEHWLEMCPLSLHWENDAGEREEVGKFASDAKPEIDNEAHTCTWRDVWGPGIHWRYNLTPDHLYPTVILEKELPKPSIDPRGLRLVKMVSMVWNDAAKPVEMYSALSSPDAGTVQEEKTSSSVLTTDATKFAAVPKSEKTESFACLAVVPVAREEVEREAWWFQTPRAWDSGEGEERREFGVKWEVVQSGAEWAGRFSVLAEDLGHATYPVFVDTDISEEQVGASADDASDYGTTWPGSGGSPSITATSCSLGYTLIAATTYYYSFGARFTTVPIPQGATIDSSTMALNSHASLTYNTDLAIYAEDVDDAATFNTSSHMPGSATRTTATARWNIGTAAWVAGNWADTPDIKACVQEVIDRASWAENNDLALFIFNYSTGSASGDLYRQIHTYDETGNVSGPKFSASYTAGEELTLDLSDTVTVSDASTFSFGKSLADTVTVSDALTRGYGKALGDTTTLSDSLTKEFGLTPFGDTLTLSDSLVKSIGKALADGLTLSDSLVKSISKGLSDTLTLFDTWVQSVGKSIADIATLSDDLLRAFGKSLSDTLSLSDAWSRVVDYVRTWADGFTLSDTFSFSAIWALLMGDTVTLSDGVTKKAGKTLGDGVTLSDGLGKEVGKTLGDGFTLSDAIAKAVGKTLADTVTLTDHFYKSIGGIVTLLRRALFRRSGSRSSRKD